MSYRCYSLIMSKPLVLRCQFGGGQRKVLNGLSGVSTVCDLTEAIFSITGVAPHRQRIMSGFPPKELVLPEAESSVELMGIRSGDTLIIEEIKEQPKILPSKAKLVRRVVPADNSCLFSSLSFLMLNGEIGFAVELRELASNCISEDPNTYNEAFLGMPNADYCKWLSSPDHWGGAIELAVLSKYYQTEINVADVQSGRVDRFGENKNYNGRVFLLYDGIHYDPLGLELNGEIIQTVFTNNSDDLLVEALAIAENCKKQHQYTDLAGFSLRCLVCRTPLVGQIQAQEHAKTTGHTNFGEV